MKTDYTREELIDLCRDAVVHHTGWGNRDSYSSQVNIQEAYRALTAGWDFEIDPDTDDRTVWVLLTPVSGIDTVRDGEWLSISSLDEYFQDCDPEYETEMFDCYRRYLDGPFTAYIPTRERLDQSAGGDWY